MDKFFEVRLLKLKFGWYGLFLFLVFDLYVYLGWLIVLLNKLVRVCLIRDLVIFGMIFNNVKWIGVFWFLKWFKFIIRCVEIVIFLFFVFFVIWMDFDVIFLNVGFVRLVLV